MRTVTFSDAGVGEALTADFVCAWENRVEGFHDCNPATEQWIFKSSADAYTTRNICTFFLTPDLQVLHYMAGYFAPGFFLEELRFALKLRDGLFTTDLHPLDGATDRYVSLHQKRGKEVAQRAPDGGYEIKLGGGSVAYLSDGPRKEAPADTMDYDKDQHVHKLGCRPIIREAYAYIARIHQDLAAGGKGDAQEHARSTKRYDAQELSTIKAIPLLGELKYRYLYGNPFAEEQSAKAVRRPQIE